MRWLVLQLGSREHYSIPVALLNANVLGALLTDSWLSNKQAGLIRPFHPSLAARRNDQLPDSIVVSNTIGRLFIDIMLKAKRISPWEAVLQRNEWFGQWAAKEIEKRDADTIFSYSYTARKPFLEAGRKGAKRILGQIDGAWVDERHCSDATRAYRDLEFEPDEAPPEYWKLWREELDLADVIVVNSEWSKKMVVESGAAPNKMAVIPLVYEQRENDVTDLLVTRHTAHATDASRRLTALYLGNVSLRKGMGQLFDAIRMLKSEPVDIIFAGPVMLRIPADIQAMAQIRFLGPVDRMTAEQLYADSDVFLFPTLSDGFGRTQLEALGHGCPVIASTHCGQVVEDRVNGLVLPEVTPEAIAEAIMLLVRDRDLLAKLQSQARVPDKFHPRHLAPALLALTA